MKGKLYFVRSLLAALLICMLAWDGLLLLKEHTWMLPETHQQLLRGGFLVWFLAILAGKNSDDDWAGFDTPSSAS